MSKYDYDDSPAPQKDSRLAIWDVLVYLLSSSLFVWLYILWLFI